MHLICFGLIPGFDWVKGSCGFVFGPKIGSLLVYKFRPASVIDLESFYKVPNHGLSCQVRRTDSELPRYAHLLCYADECPKGLPHLSEFELVASPPRLWSK